MPKSAYEKVIDLAYNKAKFAPLEAPPVPASEPVENSPSLDAQVPLDAQTGRPTVDAQVSWTPKALGRPKVRPDADYISRKLRDRINLRLPKAKLHRFKVNALERGLALQEWFELAGDFLCKAPLDAQVPLDAQDTWTPSEPAHINRNLIDLDLMMISSISSLFSTYTGRTPSRKDLYWMKQDCHRRIEHIEIGIVTTVLNKLRGSTADVPINSYLYCRDEILKAEMLKGDEELTHALRSIRNAWKVEGPK
jgi:hypothetical protein